MVLSENSDRKYILPDADNDRHKVHGISDQQLRAFASGIIEGRRMWMAEFGDSMLDPPLDILLHHFSREDPVLSTGELLLKLPAREATVSRWLQILIDQGLLQVSQPTVSMTCPDRPAATELSETGFKRIRFCLSEMVSHFIV